MRGRLLMMFLAASVLCAPVPAEGRGGAFGKNYLQQITESLKLVFVADAQLYHDLVIVSQSLKEFYVKNRHLPMPGAEQDNFRIALAKEIPFNPYKPQVINMYTNEPEPSPMSVYFLSDAGITRESVKQWKTNPPPSWQGEPGSIFILTNGKSLFMLWGASADRLPMKNLQTDNSVRLIFHDLSGAAAQRAVADSQQAQ